MRSGKSGPYKTRIADADDFELGFLSVLRLYGRDRSEEMLDLAIITFDEYEEWFDRKALVNSLRDLLHGGRMWFENKKIPANHKKRYEKLIKRVTERGLSIELGGKSLDESKWEVLSFGRLSEFFDYHDKKEETFSNGDDFYEWVNANHFRTDLSSKTCKTGTWPMRKRFIPFFRKICRYTISYAYGRFTYMPGVARDLVKKNIYFFDDNALFDLSNHIKNLLRERPIGDAFGGREDSEEWERFACYLDMELVKRKAFSKMKKLNQIKNGQIENHIKQYAQLDSLKSEMDCNTAWYCLDGIELFLTTSCEGMFQVDRYLREIIKAKQEIAALSEKYWFEENCNVYEKIGDHLYQRKAEAAGRGE